MSTYKRALLLALSLHPARRIPGADGIIVAPCKAHTGGGCARGWAAVVKGTGKRGCAPAPRQVGIKNFLVMSPSEKYKNLKLQKKLLNSRGDLNGREQ